MELDRHLLYDICLYKWNYGLKNPIDINITNIEERETDILISISISNNQWISINGIVQLKFVY
jgi:hypothetical protein